VEVFCGSLIVLRWAPRDFTDQNIPAFAPERVPITGPQCDAFAGLEYQFVTRRVAAQNAVAHDLPPAILSEIAIVIRTVKFHHKISAATIDDILGLDDMGVHR